MNDQISRQAAIDAAWFLHADDRDALRDTLRKLPSVSPVKHGKWVDVMTEEWCTFDECKCSVCGVVECFNKGWKKFYYCPNCGARMDGE